MEIYTDGSYSPLPESPYKAGSGWGVVVVKQIGKARTITKFGGGKKGSNAQEMEHIAMFEAIKYFANSTVLECTIVSDSQYMIKSLAGTFTEIEVERLGNKEQVIKMVSKEYSKITELDGWSKGWFPNGKGKARWDLWLEIYKLMKEIFSSGKTLTFRWVRAHNGIKYNEMVDVLAKNSRL